ncbi:KH domain-containing, RNA-binding, signal transduction-associated protein 2-like [Arctopsyche grandis]|uniref:KH domain-containing, RNA-binding, signal transduction-associated protein 2-like n=1 Tax=Arctopsyche grandis TaxID=121162 RepID=UPI00406DA454
MADKYDKNGYGSGDFKRDPAGGAADDALDGDAEEGGAGGGAGGGGAGGGAGREGGAALAERAGDYMRDLLQEKLTLDHAKFPICVRLIDQEVSRVQTLGRVPTRDMRYVDIYREKPIKVSVKVRVPVREHPKFNFVGKLLGPKGISMKRLQEETMCKMAVLGRGSMKDRQKEEELRQALDPKYAHLSDDLHVEISALGPPAEAHARIAFALAEVRKYLIPDNNDLISQEQIREMMDMCGPQSSPPVEPTATRGRGRGIFRPPVSRGGVVRGVPPTRSPLPTPRVMPAKTKIMSILDRARAAMEETYGYEEDYKPVSGVRRGVEEEPFHHSHYSVAYEESPSSLHHHHDPYYDGPPSGSSTVTDSYHYVPSSRHHAPPEHEYGGSTTSSHHHHRSYKGISATRSDSHSGIRRATSASREARYRSSPYPRPTK